MFNSQFPMFIRWDADSAIPFCRPSLLDENRSKVELNRRELLKSVLGGTVAFGLPSLLRGQGATSVSRLSDKLSVIDGGGANVVAFSFTDAFVLVDGGAPKSGGQVMTALKSL